MYIQKLNLGDNVKTYIVILALVCVLFVGACGTATETKTTNKSGDKTKTEDTTKPKNDTSALLTPTDTVKAFINAYLKKDVGAMKKILSKKSLANMEKAAKAMNSTLDKYLEKFRSGENLPFKSIPEMQNEKIDGDKAYVDVKINSKWQKTPLVKEDGIWKFSFEN